VREYCRKSAQVHYLYEPLPGLSRARNRGWQEANGAYVAFVDDDCMVPPGWIARALRIIDSPAPPAFGGPYYAFYNTPKPRWFQDAYGSHCKTATPRPLAQDEYLNGGNMFVRRDWLRRAGGFDPGLGMAAGAIGYGEETDLLQRMRVQEPAMVAYYHPALFVYHLVRSQKMTWRWLIRDRFVHGRSDYDVQPSARLRAAGPVRLAGAVLVRIARIVLGVFKMPLRDRRRYPYWQNYAYERLLGEFSVLGAYYEHARRLARGRAAPATAGERRSDG
jgi:GT2 family glycosyltransferase